MADEKLIFDLVAGQNTVVKELEKISKSSAASEQAVAGLGAGFKRVGVAVASIGAAVGGFAAIAAAISKATRAASEEEDAINRLNSALKINGNFSETASRQLQDYADQLGKTSKIGGEVTLANLALLQSLAPLTQDGLIAANNAAVDLSAALRIDLESAVRLVAKAAQGNTDAFKRYGIEIKKGTSDAETFANALAKIQENTGGAAANELNTFSGATTQLGSSIGDVVKQLGFFITESESVNSAIRSTTVFFNNFADAIKRTREEPSQLDEAFNSGKIGPVIKLYSQLGISISSAKSETVAFGSAAQGLQGKFPDLIAATSSTDSFAASLSKSSSTLGDVSSNLGKTVELLKNATGLSDEARRALESQLKTVEGALKNAGVSAFDQIAIAGRDRLKTINDAFRAGIISTEKERFELQRRNQIKITEEIAKAQTDLQRQQLDDASAFLDSISGRARGAGQQGDASRVSSDNQNILIAARIGESLTSGAQGAVQAFSALTQSIVSAIPVVGQLIAPVVGKVVELFAQGPEAVRKTFQEFLTNIPKIALSITQSVQRLPAILLSIIPEFLSELIRTLPEILIEQFVGGAVAFIEAVAINAPLIIERLISGLPELLQRFADGIGAAVRRFIDAMPQAVSSLASAMPQVASRLATELISQAPLIAASFVTELVKEAPRFITELIKAIPQAAGGALSGVGGGLLGGIGGAIGGIGGSIKKAFKFSEGGIVPGSAPFTDRVPALLTPGETVIDRSLTQMLEKFLNSAGDNGSGAPQMMTVNLVVGESELASVMVDLNRRGFRLA